MEIYSNPLVGEEGFFETKEPFSVDKEIKHQVVRVTTISSLLTEGRDPYEDLYKPNALSLNAYSEALSRDIKIVTLRDIDGEEIEIPLDYFLSKPLQSTYNYQQIILTVNLGFLEENVPLENLKTLIEQACGTVSSKDVDLKVIATDSGLYISEQKHQELEVERLAGIEVTESLANRINDLELEKLGYQETITKQNALIKNLMEKLNSQK